MLTYKLFSLHLSWTTRLKIPAGQLQAYLPMADSQESQLKVVKQTLSVPVALESLTWACTTAWVGHGFSVSHENELWSEEFCVRVSHIILIKRLQKARMTSHFYFSKILLWLKRNFKTKQMWYRNETWKMRRIIVSSSEQTHSDLEIHMEFEDQCYVLDIVECWTLTLLTSSWLKSGECLPYAQ